MKLTIDVHGGGLGDHIVCAWIAEGANAAGWDVAFTRGPGVNHVNDRILAMFGQRLTNDPGVRIHDGGGCAAWNLTIGGIKLDRTRLWQMRLSELAKVKLKVEPIRPKLVIPEDAMDWAIGHKAAAGKRKLAIIFPFAAWKMRSWPLHKYVRLAYALNKAGFYTIASHPKYDGKGADGREQGDLGAMPLWMYGQSIEQIAALCKVADCVIGGGSGGIHLSATIGTPTFGILGSDDAVVSHGYCPEYIICQTPTSRLACSGCQFDPKRGFSNVCDSGCDALESLSWEEVYKTIMQWKEARDNVPVHAKG